MERPSHTITALECTAGSHRMTVMGFSVSVQMLFLSLFVMGVATTVTLPQTGPLTMSNIQEEVMPQTPPPPIPRDIVPVSPVVAPPLITTLDPPAANGGLTVSIEPPRTVVVTPPSQPPVVKVADRAAAIIAETHTIPPYPPMERRLGMEGRVMLRLTVQPDGRVGQAEVTKSSGRPALDQAAQQWIVAHWTYRPAIRDGAPAAAQVLAAVNFTLTNP